LRSSFSKHNIWPISQWWGCISSLQWWNSVLSSCGCSLERFLYLKCV